MAGAPNRVSATPGKPSAALIFASTVAVSSRPQSIARSACFISGRKRPRTDGSPGSNGVGIEVAGRIPFNRLQHGLRRRLGDPRCDTGWIFAARSGNASLAQIGPASISASACSTVTPHSGHCSWIAQSSADGPRSPTIPGA